MQSFSQLCVSLRGSNNTILADGTTQNPSPPICISAMLSRLCSRHTARSLTPRSPEYSSKSPSNLQILKLKSQLWQQLSASRQQQHSGGSLPLLLHRPAAAQALEAGPALGPGLASMHAGVPSPSPSPSRPTCRKRPSGHTYTRAVSRREGQLRVPCPGSRGASTSACSSACFSWASSSAGALLRAGQPPGASGLPPCEGGARGTPPTTHHPPGLS